MMGYRENWSGVDHVYTGSIVSLFTHRFLAGTHSGSYYTPPNRKWSFDTRYQSPSNLPPGTPAVGSVVQTAFRPVY
jgi:hypothetical protein